MSKTRVMEKLEGVEEQLPGQMDIMEFPEYLPESMKGTQAEVLKGEVVDAESVNGAVMEEKKSEEPQKDNVQQVHEEMKAEHLAPVQKDRKEMVSDCEAALANMIAELDEHFVNGDLDKMSAVATSMVWKIKTFKKLLEEKNE